MKKLKKYWVILPVLVLAAILYLTFQSGSDTSSLTLDVKEGLVDFLESLGIPRIVLVHRWWFDFSNFRKLAHTVEYFVLAITITIVLLSLRKKNAFFIAFLSSLCISLIDQSIRIFLPTREFSGIDLLFDLAGYGAGVAVVLIIVLLYRGLKRIIKKRREKTSKE